MASCNEQPPVPTPPIFWTVVVTKILAPDVVCAVAFGGPIVRLATANKAPTPQKLKASKERTLKNPEVGREVFCIGCLLFGFEAVHPCTVPNSAGGYAENAESFTEDNSEGFRERAKRTKVRFCRTFKSPGFLRFLLLGTNPLKQDFAAFLFFGSICPGQNHPGNAVFENRLVKINQQPERNIQQLHIAEELCLAGRVQHLDRF